MRKISINSVINTIMFLYILSLYLFTFRSEMTIYSNAIAFLLVFFIWMNFFINKEKIVFNKLLIIYLLFIIICSSSIFYALDSNIAISRVKTLTLIFIMMVSLVNYIDTFEKIKNIIIYFIYSGVITSFYILTNSDFSQITRFGGELGNVNAIGMIIGISTIFCIYIILSEKKYWYTLFLIVMFSTILLTGSRKALLFILINVILIIFFKNRKSFKNSFKVIVISLCVLLGIYYLIFNIPLFYQIIGYRVENLYVFINGEGTNEGSINERAYMIKFGINMFMNKPFFGYGIDNYRVLLGMNSGIETYAHNNYIELMVDTGILGVAIYYLTHIVVIKELFYASKKITDKTLCYVFISIIISYIILSWSLIYYDSKHFSILLSLAGCINMVAKSDKEKIFN